MDREYFRSSLARRDERRVCVVEWSDAVGRFSPGDAVLVCPRATGRNGSACSHISECVIEFLFDCLVTLAGPLFQSCPVKPQCCATGCVLDATAGHKDIPCGNVRTVRMFACIRGILAIGHVGSASEHWTSGVTESGVASHGYCAIHSTEGIALHIYPLKGNSYHGHYNQDGCCHRVCRRSLILACLWHRKHGRNRLDVASNFVCRRT